MNGDLLTQPDFASLIDFHNSGDADVTIAVRRVFHKLRFGVIETDEQGVVRAVREKPTYSWDVNSGIYVVSESVRRLVPRQGRYDMNQLISDQLDKKGRVLAWQFDDEWNDIGVPEDLYAARGDSAEWRTSGE